VKLWQRALGHSGEERHDISTVNDWIMAFGGHQYPLGLPQTIRGDKEPPPTTYEAYAVQLFGANPIVWTGHLVRKAVFSQGRFKYQRDSNGELWGDPGLRLLERPWVGGTTKKLLTRAVQHADIGGSAYALSIPGLARPRIQLMRPDYVTIVMGSQLEPDDPSLAEDAELVGYMYAPPGIQPRFYFPDEVGHFAPMPDPLAHFRGMSWMTPIIREVLGDKQATEHKLKFFEQGATPNLIIRFDPSQTVKQVQAFKDLVEDEHQGLADAYRTMYLGGGADATVVGANMQQLDFSALMGKAETRILMAAGVHPVVAGASEGMQGASLNAGNFVAIRRLFSDVHLQDLWGCAAEAFETLVKVPPGSSLAVDTRRIAFLQDDAKDDAEIGFTNARAITLYVREGFTEESAKLAVATGDLSLLQHTGLVSVQLQKRPDPNAASAGDDLEGTGDITGTEADEDPDAAKARAIAEILQKSYLAVGISITAEEARQLANRAGGDLAAELPDELKPKPVEPPVDPAADPLVDPAADDEGDGDDQNPNDDEDEGDGD
jgi:hypothetical protein